MTKKMKLKLFEKVLELMHKAAERDYVDYERNERVNGAVDMLKVLGLEDEYMVWSENK